MSGFSNLRSDRGVLAPPVSATIYEGRVARVHKPGDALIYSSGPEHRDTGELSNIVSQLPGIKVYLGHPTVYPAKDSDQKVVGYVESGRVDEDTAVARIVITDEEAVEAIRSDVKELSLGYSCSLDGDRYQRGITLDHLALVDRARCSGVCSLRVDMLAPVTEENMKVGTLEVEVKLTGVEEVKKALDAMSSNTMEKCEKCEKEPCVCEKADGVSPSCACKNHAINHNNGETMSDIKADETATEMEALKAKLEEAHKALTALEIEATNARKDAEAVKGQLDAALQAAEDAKTEAAAAVQKAKLDAEEALANEVQARVDARVALVVEAKPYLADMDLSKMSDREIKCAVIKHVDGDSVPAEKSIDYVTGVYEGALKRAGAAATSREVARVAVNEMRKDNAPLTGVDAERAAKEKMLRESAQAWVK